MSLPCPQHHATEALLLDRRFGVRPPGEPLPPALRGRLLGRLFGRWLRQRDDAARAAPKAALVQALAALPASTIEQQTRQQAALALPGGWDHWCWSVPLATTASLLGLPLPDLAAQRQLRAQLQALARGLAGEQLDAADAASTALLQALATAQGPLQIQGPWADDEDLAANRLALLWQSYEAGAALLANALARLSTTPALRRPGQRLDWLPQLVREGGAVLNTRRFAQEALHLDGQLLVAGELRLIDLTGTAPGFGAGPHRCPGQDLALRAIAAALEWLLAQPRVDWPRDWQVLTLPNARIPRFDPETEA